jgi:hypothetical protein
MSAPIVLLGTTSHALTSTPYTFTPDEGIEDSNVQSPKTAWTVRCWSDQPFHVRTDGQPATTSDCPVAAGYHGLTVKLAPNGSISVLKQADASADGTIWFSKIKRA